MREVCFKRPHHLLLLHSRSERDSRIEEQNIDGIAQTEQGYLVGNERNREVVERDRADERCFGRVLRRGVLRQREHIEIGGAILADERIELRIG